MTTTDVPSLIELRYGDNWVREACLLAHPVRPYAFYGCHKVRNHDGDCDHESRRTLCRHRGGMYPCHGVNGEHCNCPQRDQDAGDEG